MMSTKTWFTTRRSLLWAAVIALLLASCSAPQPARTPAQVTPAVGVTHTRGERATRPSAEITTGGVTVATPTIAASPASTSQATTAPTPLPSPTSRATAAATPSYTAPSYSTPVPVSGAAASNPGSGTGAEASSSLVPSYQIPVQAPSLNPNKYPAPVPVTPPDGAVYHVAQPVVHFVWTNTPAQLLLFGEESQCTSDATYFRHTFETNQLVIHSLNGQRPDRVQWQDAGTEFYLNLTTVPAGQYAWWVNIGVVCESYVIGKRDTTINRTYLGQVSPSSTVHTFTWTP